MGKGNFTKMVCDSAFQDIQIEKYLMEKTK
jgi:hypothetical protein